MIRRVLFAIPENASYKAAIQNSLTQLGYNVYHFDYLKPDILSRAIGLSANIFKLPSIREQLGRYINRQLVNLAYHLRPDFFLTIKGEVFYAQTINELNRIGVKTINWFPDNDELWELLIMTAPSYTYYASVCQYLTWKLNKFGRKTLYLPLAGAADMEFQNIPKLYDIVFAGHKTKKRERYFSYLKKFNFYLWGYPHWQDSPLAYRYRGYIKPDATKQVYRQTKVVLNVTTGESSARMSIANLRNFEATGVGAFTLSEYSPALAELFKEDREMVFFRSPTEMLTKLKYYLKREDIRNKIAYRGWLKTKKKHSYIHRMRNLFTYIQKRG